MSSGARRRPGRLPQGRRRRRVRDFENLREVPILVPSVDRPREVARKEPYRVESELLAHFGGVGHGLVFVEVNAAAGGSAVVHKLDPGLCTIIPGRQLQRFQDAASVELTQRGAPLLIKPDGVTFSES